MGRLGASCNNQTFNALTASRSRLTIRLSILSTATPMREAIGKFGLLTSLWTEVPRVSGWFMTSLLDAAEMECVSMWRGIFGLLLGLIDRVVRGKPLTTVR